MILRCFARSMLAFSVALPALAAQTRQSSTTTPSALVELLRLKGPITRTSSLAFSPDGNLAVSGSGDQTTFLGLGNLTWVDCTVRLWDLKTGRELRRLEGHKQAVTCVAFSPDGSAILSAGADNTVRLWDAASGKQIRQLEGNYGVFSPDGRTVAVAPAFRAGINLFNVQSGEQVQKMVGHLDGTGAIAFSPDGKYLLSAAASAAESGARESDGSKPGADSFLRLWDTATGKAIRPLVGHSQAPVSVAFDAGGQRAISISPDRTIRVWEISSGRMLTSTPFHIARQTDAFGPPPPESPVLGPSRERFFMVSADRLLRIFDVNSGKQIAAHALGDRHLVRLAVSPDGKRLLAAQATFPELLLLPLPDAP